MKTALIRQNYNSPDFKQLYSMLEAMKGFLDAKVDTKDERWLSDFDAIASFQDSDGSFKLLDSFKVESDARVDFCYMPTYICAAIYMKAFMTDRSSMKGREQMLKRALESCCGRNLSGHGYDAFRGQLEALNIFTNACLREFLIYYADICPEFSDLIYRLAGELRDMEDAADTIGPWGEDYSEDIHALNEYFSHSVVFVYGTLLRGERNHDYYLHDKTCLGKAQITGFDMYDTGSYPAIIPGKGTVNGELYEITQEDLKRLDYLEGEGDLYIRQCVPAKTENGRIVLAHVYVYNYSTEGLEQIPEKLQPYTANWKDRLDNYVWYVSYGSNMLRERFLCYIKGGRFSSTGRYIPPCSDTSDPIAIAAYDIPYDMYFGNRSGSWEGRGVSFLDLSKPGHALGVAYLITREQLEHVSCQENGGNKPEYSVNWYNTVELLGTFEGHEVYTIANDSIREHNDPCESYLNTLYRGIAENYPDLSSSEIEEYLNSCICH